MANRTSVLVTHFVILAVMTLMLLTTLSYPGNLKNFPLIVGTPTWLTLVYLFINEIRKFKRSKAADAPEQNGEVPGGSSTLGRKFLKMASILILHVVLIYLVGFYLAILLFMIVFFAVYGGMKWWKVLLMTAIVCAAIYMMQVFLSVELYKGILFGDKTLQW